MVSKKNIQKNMRIPIGVSDFKRLIQDVSSIGEHYFYCDKSLMIKDIIDDGALVSLFTRPRRFGKTLNMSMLSYFFGNKEPLFDGLKISKYQDIIDRFHGKYPVVFISFKDIKLQTFDDMFASLADLIRKAFEQFSYAFDQTDAQFVPYFDYSHSMNANELTKSLQLLTTVLQQHHNQQVIVLIDEYDIPIQTSYLHGFYEQIITIMRIMFGAVLKDNDSLYKGILTGITKVAKANLFSGLNHFRTYDIDSEKYSQYFGFTEDEVKPIIPDHYQEAKAWYNGYIFDKVTVYNPWSILSFIDNNFQYRPYWIETAENALIQKSLTADKLIEVEKLLDGQSIFLKVDNNLILKYLRKYKYSFFNLLYTSGYLTATGENGAEYNEKYVRIPNREVREFFEDVVLKWFAGHGEGDYFQDFLDALLDGDIKGVQSVLSRIVKEAFSFKDGTKKQQESFYHGILLGITLSLKKRYNVKSNRESGYGLFDIALFPKDPKKDPGVIIEIKTKGSVDKAIEQIQSKEYSTELHEHGCSTVYLYGMAFDGKKVATKLVNEDKSTR